MPCSAIKTSLFADAAHHNKIDVLGDPLQLIAQHVYFDALAKVLEHAALRPVSLQGGPPFPIEAMVRIHLKWLNFVRNCEYLVWVYSMPVIFCKLDSEGLNFSSFSRFPNEYDTPSWIGYLAWLAGASGTCRGRAAHRD
uniref:hypothetical protein n=1 Tax=Iodobacter sp. CM08 TaxID=3085902 RepID=UPI0039903BA4